jgi:hypothetical protein
METDTAIVAAETVVAETIESEILALAAQMTPMTGDVLLLLQHAMNAAASVATDMGKNSVINGAIKHFIALEEDLMIAEAVIVSAATDTAAIDLVETDTEATETEIEATAATEIAGTVIATDMVTEIATVALDVTTGTEDTEVDTLVPLMTTINGEEPSPKFRDAIQETRSDETRHETRHESGQNCNYLKDLLTKVKYYKKRENKRFFHFKNQQRNQQRLPYSALQSQSM